jgi:glycosyltransferase involved in cell wall biosynthesis
MKILVINWQDVRNPLSGGAEVHFQEIFSRIVRLGHDVTLYCSSFPGAPSEEIIDGIRVVRGGGRLLFNFHVPFVYASRFRPEQFDVVIENLNKLPFFTPLYVRRPLGYIVHHLWGRSIFLEAPFPIALYVSALERLTLPLISSRHLPVLAVSPSTRAELIQAGLQSSQIHIVYNCVDHNRYCPSPSRRSRTPLIGYFGRIKKYKAIDHLIRAFAQIHSLEPTARLVIVGDGDHRPELQRLALELGVSAVVEFTGFATEEEKVRRMQEAWFAVNTSSKEGWGLTVIEANACGTPVIASNVPGLRDAVKDGETGLLYTFADVDELAGKMQRLLRDAQLREQLAMGSIRWAQTFSWDAMAEKTVSLLQDAIQTRAH